MKKKIIILISLILILLLSASYAWFNYRGELSNQRLLAGDLFLTLTDGVEGVNLTGIYPMTKEEARARNDNYVTFTVRGKNTSDKNVYYEIFLKYGTDLESPYERFTDKDIVFDLIEINNNTETYLLDAVSYDSINNRKIWVDSVVHNTNSTVERVYKLRMWLSDRVIISDTDPNASYEAEDYRYHYMNVKFGVDGDLNEKSLPSSATTRESYVENGKSYFMTYLTNDYLLEEEGELLDENDVVTLEITNPENKLYFSYIDSKGNENNNQNESLQLTYNYNRNETVNIKVFTESRNDTNVKTILHFKVTKNGEIVQEYNKEVYVIGNNYCLNNGFTNLADCILVTENLSNSVNSAKTYINSKGSPNINTTAPTYTYVEEQIQNVTYVGESGYPNWRFSDKYEFNSSTGTFTLKKEDGTTNETSTVPLSNDVVGKYTAGTTRYGYSSLGAIFKIDSVDTVNNSITGTKITYKITSSFDSQVGLYRVQDNDGDSYIYRGDVKNNNVYFGGYYWKIIRVNGDNSVRMIFNGKTLAANGNKLAGNAVGISTTESTGTGSTYAFNQVSGGPTYVGYMTTEETNYWTTSSLINYTLIVENTSYYFGDSFETYTDEWGNRVFRLTGNTYSSRLKDLTQAQIDAKPYTCSGTTADKICTKLVKLNSRVNNTTISGYYITYSPNYVTDPSLTKTDVEKNELDSNAKRQLDIWYQNKFMNNDNNGKLAKTYLADAPFCNDRSITRTGSYNSGYLLTDHTYYSPRTRFIDTASPNKTATLMCSKNDSFTVTETSSTNGKLTYPIGLISIDEVALAGGKYNEKNENFYLRSNSHYWTMTPAWYIGFYALSAMMFVGPNALFDTSTTPGTMALRAVINLKADTLISSSTPGDGSIEHPYIIE